MGVLTKPCRKVAPCSPTCLPVRIYMMNLHDEFTWWIYMMLENATKISNLALAWTEVSQVLCLGHQWGWAQCLASNLDLDLAACKFKKNLALQWIDKGYKIQPSGLVNKFGVWWVVRTGEAWRTVARPPENVHSNPFSPLIRTWRLTRWWGRGGRRQGSPSSPFFTFDWILIKQSLNWPKPLGRAKFVFFFPIDSLSTRDARSAGHQYDGVS